MSPGKLYITEEGSLDFPLSLKDKESFLALTYIDNLVREELIAFPQTGELKCYGRPQTEGHLRSKVEGGEAIVRVDQCHMPFRELIPPFTLTDIDHISKVKVTSP